MSDPNIQHNPTPHAVASHGHADQNAPHGMPFTQEEWQEFHKSDIGAGGAVIALMTAIFSIGLLLYTVIAFVVAA